MGLEVNPVHHTPVESVDSRQRLTNADDESQEGSSRQKVHWGEYA